ASRPPGPPPRAAAPAPPSPAEAAVYAADAVAFQHLRTPGVREGEWRAQAELLRDLFGPLPFRAAALSPSHRTPDAVGLATAIYEERAFDRLPILADALEEAGCTDPDVLGHCRAPGPHIRGCWVVDLVLGKQ